MSSEFLIPSSSKQSPKETHECKICGAPAIHSNFGAITCSPCKMFFKRNAELGQTHFICDFNDNCEINMNTRHVCSSCRLAKCFANGMQTIMIRCSISKRNSTKQKKIKADQFVTTNLLESNQSILTSEQWNLFSNLMNSYDETGGLALTERFISEQNVLPFKFRFKCRVVLEFLSTLFSKIEILLEKNQDFLCLHFHDRSILLRSQMKYLAIISSSFIAQQTHLFEYPGFSETIKIIFKTNIFVDNQENFFTFDIPFIKLVLGIISFSIYDYTNSEYLGSFKSIRDIQHRYIELAWRYLIYTYDDKQAIQSFSNLIRSILIIIDNVILIHDNNYFTGMINSLVQRTEQIFIVDRK